MRLIDADALIAEWCDGCKYLENGLCDSDICGGVLLMKDAPTIDAVEVVRCKECGLQYGCKVGQYLGNDGFCSYGERSAV